MELFKSGNPTLTEKIFDRSANNEAGLQGTMTVGGTMNKFGFLLLMVIGGAAYTWHLYASLNVSLMTTLMITGVIGGLICGFAMVFKPTWAQYIAPLYAI